MRFSVITPNYNGELFLESTILSVLKQKENSVDVQYIVVDGDSTDGSHDIIQKYRSAIDKVIIEKDTGPANAINKGFSAASGDVISWLNADDHYYPAIFQRVDRCFKKNTEASFCFGRCPIINENNDEIRHSITKFKEFFFPFSSRFVFQSINYISQPAMFFRKDLLEKIGFLREDMVAAWDYEFMLRLWRCGDGHLVPGRPLAAFRWHGSSISGQFFRTQFKEELDATISEAGRWAPQTLLHHCVRWGIVGVYSAMSKIRQMKGK